MKDPTSELACERHFLGWDAPVLVTAADRLASSPTRLAHTAVCVPGSRSGRRLLERLVDREPNADAPVLTPPHLFTPRQLTERLLVPLDRGRLASDLECQLLWVEALTEIDGAWLEIPFPDRFEGDPYARFEAAVRLSRLRAELGGEGLKISDVAPEEELDRWRALAVIEDAYERALGRRELHDLTSAADHRLNALPLGFDRRGLPFDRVVLLGLAEVGSRLRALLHHHGLAVESWIAAPESEADAFDECGAVRPAAWLERRLPIRDDRLHVAQDPRQLAQRLLERIESAVGSEPTAPDAVTVGLADASLVGVVERTLFERGLPTHDARGRAFALTAPAELLRRASSYGRSRRFDDFAALVRHPDLATWIEEQDERSVETFYAALDRYHEDHLPGTWPPPAPMTNPWPWTTPLLELVHPFSESRPLARWSRSILELLRFAYRGRELDTRRADDAFLIEALSAAKSALESWLEVESEEWRGTDAIRLLLQSLETTLLADPDRGPAAELVGWLELPLDDADFVFVAGLDEASVPGRPQRDIFLPDALRRQLGLPDRRRRYARDAFALSVVVHSHRHVEWFLTRRALDNSPLFPSRLLLAEPPRIVARRWLRFVNADAAAVDTEPLAPHAHQPPRPRADAPPVTGLRVTAFGSYLGCPYRFYLRYVERLTVHDDSAVELDGGAFGSFLHDVLRAFGEDERIARETDPLALTRYFDAGLAHGARERWGAAPLPTVRIQIELARERLHAFAPWQARRAAEGWRIHAVEAAVEQHPWMVDHVPFGLSGRIDRIDRHEQTGEFALLDYKSSDHEKAPEETHRKKDGTWIDLQLPLYRHLAHAFDAAIDPARLTLAYVALPRPSGLARATSPLLAAAWSAEDLASADECARDVVRRVRDRVFWPPTEPPPPFSETFSPIVQDGRLIAGSDELLLDVPAGEETSS